MARGRTIKVDGTTVEERELGEEETRSAVIEASGKIVDRLYAEVKERIRLRAPIEERWLEDLRNYHGRYREDIEKSLVESRRSQAFVKITRHKTNSWSARLSDLLFPTDDSNWGIKPTPLPRLAKAAKEAVAQARKAVESANEQQDPRMAEAIAQQASAFAQQAQTTHEEIEEAKKRCEGMQEAIEDQLVEAKYGAQAREAIEDGCQVGTGIIKGPLTSNRLRREWRPGQFGFELVQIPDPMPEFRRVDYWHFFPDMSARTIEDSESEFERSLPSKKELRKFAMKLGFNREAVKKLLREGPDPLGSEVDHIATLRQITGEGEAIQNRYIMYEFHGSLEIDEIVMLLRASGKEEEADRIEEENDPMQDHRVIMYFCQGEVLKIEPFYPLDSGETLYSVWNFEKGETSIFGIGVPRIMNDSQAAINGAWRMTMDNAGLSVGPQILIDKDGVTPQDGSYHLKPLKIWLLSSTANTSPQRPAFQVHNIPNNQAQLAGIIEMAKIFADEETSMPDIANGEQGSASKTVGGMSMLFNSANVVFRRVVKSFDDQLTTPTIRRAYDWNMQFNPDEAIKGDMQVDARGTSVLLVREIQSLNLLNIMTNWTIHPVIGSYIKVREGLKKSLQTMMIPPDDVLFTQDEADRRLKEAAEQNAAAAEGEQAPPDNRLEIAKLESETRLQVAQMTRETALIELAQREKMSLADLQAKLQMKDIDTKSKERMFAGKLGAEEQRAQRAVREGKGAEQATGVGIG